MLASDILAYATLFLTCTGVIAASLACAYRVGRQDEAAAQRAARLASLPAVAVNLGQGPYDAHVVTAIEAQDGWDEPADTCTEAQFQEVARLFDFDLWGDVTRERRAAIEAEDAEVARIVEGLTSVLALPTPA